jgi:hypothetical protein
MTLVEALKKNKPLRRPIEKHKGRGDGYMAPEYVFHLLISGQIRYNEEIPKKIRPIVINKQDILATDWEIQE